MLKTGAAYYAALTGEDGKLAPFADDCERRENGMTTAGTREKNPPPMPITATDPAIRSGGAGSFHRKCQDPSGNNSPLTHI
jgi:hypothetical protein